MATDFRDYLDLEQMLTNALSRSWAVIANKKFSEVRALLAANDFESAAAAVSTLDLSPVGESNSGMIYTVLAGCVDHGASVVSGERTRTNSTDFPLQVKNSATQLMVAMEAGATAYLQRKLLQLIAQTKSQHEQGLVQKADPVRDFVSFRQDGDDYLQMVSALHSSRLSGWGFLAEAEASSITTYKLNAMLDKRTSMFCRFCHGKVFQVSDARPLLDAAMLTDNPEDLKTIQPWPNQSKDSMEQYKQMSADELVKNKLHVPPFHPGCRTMMVKLSTTIRTPKVVGRPKELPEYTSTVEDFTNLKIKINEGGVNVWNDYLKINPSQSLTLLTGKPMAEALAAVAPKTISVSAKGNVKWALPNMTLVFDPLVSQFRVSKIVGGVAPALASTKALASSVGAASIAVRVKGMDAVEYLALGYKPASAEWQDLRLKLAESLAGKLDDLTDQAVGLILSSTDPSGMLKLYGIATDSEVVRRALSGVQFTAVLVLDDTGLK